MSIIIESFIFITENHAIQIVKKDINTCILHINETKEAKLNIN